ncbi:MAG: helix-turn-helix domain-containing protein [Hyphomicrobiales bacterium]
MKKTITIARIRPDGRLVRIRADGREADLTPASTASPAPKGEVFDRDNPPLTPEQLKSMRRLPRIKTLRRVLQLTQEEFARRYHIPIGTLRDWEQGRSEPDAPARALLKVIATDPDGVMKALGGS